MFRGVFSSHNLLDGFQSKLLEGKGVIVSVPIEGFSIQQSHNHAIGNPALKDVVFFPTVCGALKSVGSDFSSDHGILSIRFFLSFQSESLVQVRIQSQLTQHESDYDVLRQQPNAFVVGSSGKLSSPIGPEIRIAEVELNLDFRLRYQNFTRAKHFQMRYEHQPLLFVDIISRGCFQCSSIGFLGIGVTGFLESVRHRW